MTGKNISKLEKVISGGYCIGCGGCAVDDNNITIRDDIFGMPQAEIERNSFSDEICPFASTISEDEISDRLYKQNTSYDERIGRYISNYIGFVAEPGYRDSGSSGGMVSWVLAQLFLRGEIDGVIHVGTQRGSGYAYRVSETLDEIVENSKSRYYPVHYDEVLKSILGNGKKYAFVGVPCFVKSVRLLSLKNEDIAKSVKYCIAIFCGHMKTKAFSEMISMQQGISPSKLKSVDFRVKTKHLPASNYNNQVCYTESTGEERYCEPVPISDLYGLDWGLGYFKPRACDWCDDIAGETADLSCGDAWLPEVVNDPHGNNILITRNLLIDSIINDGIENGSLVLSSTNVEKVYESQAGNYRHRREGLSVRIADANKSKTWAPAKRTNASSFEVSARRQALYRHRGKISIRSHSAFIEAKNRNSFLFFMIKMLPYEIFYHFLNRRPIRGTVKTLYQYGQYAKRVFSASS
ncbi:Coenzyme F420 hydrogenase/dehydrogenase, beta subunit C-terminal domain [Sulfitobacter pontiacus]|uniref:Coenzyme F420 hydrogenase/dehydrogenase, beta subunit C-terminal domain n=1 Tax=Sulfitobacter pontiacus TaxID=60137 RepID=UPI0030EB8002